MVAGLRAPIDGPSDLALDLVQVLSESGAFRKDLYYRLSVICLHLPPLRDRLEDLPFLIQDITSRELRVPGGGEIRHPNGFVGVLGVLVTTPDVAATQARFARLRERGTVPVEVRGGPQSRLSWRLAWRDLSRRVDRPSES